MVGAAWRVSQRSKVVIERVVFLHDHNNMFHFFQVAVGMGGRRCQKSQN
jgi:hypothetical protein